MVKRLMQVVVEDRESLLERQREQKAGQQLDTGEHDAKFLEQARPVSVQPLSARFGPFDAVPGVCGSSCCGTDRPGISPAHRANHELVPSVRFELTLYGF